MQGVRDIYSAEGTPMEAKAPLAVLVNKGTASASEVSAQNTCGVHVCLAPLLKCER